MTSSMCDDCYIGSTTQTLERCAMKHTARYKAYQKGTCDYHPSFDVVQHSDARMELLFEGSFDGGIELSKLEDHYAEAELAR